jgi:hypothetical protein
MATIMAGTTLGGLLGTLGYPWIAGDRQDELAALWEQGRKNAAQGKKEMTKQVRKGTGSTQDRPVVLDASGVAYQEFLAELSLRHIKPLELIRPHFKSRNGILNELPGRHLWKNMVATLRVADQLRDELGVKLIYIASAYRSPAYNAACPGAAPNSCHMQNLALDLMYDCPPAQVAEAAHALRNRGVFKGGIGRYPTFTHIDSRGRNADWG